MKFYGPSSAYFGYTPPENGYYNGGQISTLVPDVFTCSIGGRPYIVDLDQPFYRQYRRQIAPLIRTQADTSNLPGEQSLDPNGLWRRSFEDWSDGAGQRYLDRNASVSNGYWQSKGLDTLTTKWQVSLLPDTANQYSTAATNLNVVEANGYIYITDAHKLLFANTLDGTLSWTTVTGTPAVNASSICTDGYTIYVAYGADGIYTTTAGASSASQYVTDAVGATAVIGYVNGRLMLGANGTTGNPLYNIIATGALPTALLTPYNPQTTWVGFAAGNNFLYAGANVGDLGIVYGTAVTSDGTVLTAPSIQAQLPNGETLGCVYGYLGQLIIGSSLGVRYATASTSGVTLGAIITTPGPVQCAYGYQRWVWFGWTDYDGISTGLGRIDLENFVVANVLPASSSDLMAAAQGAVLGVTVINAPAYSLSANDACAIFAVSGVGYFVQSAAQLVASGTVQSGYILYDLCDTKIACLINTETVGPLIYGSYSVAISAAAGPFNPIGLAQPGQPVPVVFSMNGLPSERFEVLLTLNRDGTTLTEGPVLDRWTLRAYPVPVRPLTWQVPLVFDEKVVDNSASTEAFDPFVELQALEAMANGNVQVVFQEANVAYLVFVQDVEFLPIELTSDKHYYNGTCLVALEGVPT